MGYVLSVWPFLSLPTEMKEVHEEVFHTLQERKKELGDGGGSVTRAGWRRLR